MLNLGQIQNTLNIPIKDLKDAVGFTKNSSVISKSIKYMRTQYHSSEQALRSIQSTVEEQRIKIRQINKLKQQEIEKDQVNKEVLLLVTSREQERSELKLKIFNDKLNSHKERMNRIKQDSNPTNSKGQPLRDLFQRINEEKQQIVPLPKKINEHNYVSEPNTFGLTDVLVEVKKKEHRKLKKEQQSNINPFEVFGTKEVWDKINELANNNQPVKFPEIGIEKTPIFQIQRQQYEKTQNKKNDFISRLQTGQFMKNGQVNKLNFLSMYNEINKMKAYQSRMEKYDPIHKNLLSHKLATAMQSAEVLWGEDNNNLRRKTYDSFEHSMDELLNDSNIPREQSRFRSQDIRQKYVFSKHHLKIKLN